LHPASVGAIDNNQLERDQSVVQSFSSGHVDI
jgi:hypothetical protein